MPLRFPDPATTYALSLPLQLAPDKKTTQLCQLVDFKSSQFSELFRCIKFSRYRQTISRLSCSLSSLLLTIIFSALIICGLPGLGCWDRRGKELATKEDLTINNKGGGTADNKQYRRGHSWQLTIQEGAQLTINNTGGGTVDNKQYMSVHSWQ